MTAQPRAYRSPGREARARRTRRRVLEAATRAFVERGYAGSTMRAVADDAAVSVPTVEQLFGTKARLLEAAVDVAIAGDDDPVPVLERGWTGAARAAADAAELLAVVAGVLTAAQERAAGLLTTLFEAARTDSGLSPLADRMAARREITAAWVVDALHGLGPLRQPRDEAVETLWLLMEPALFDRLVRARGWTPDRYAAWFARTALRLLVCETPAPETPTTEHPTTEHPSREEPP